MYSNKNFDMTKREDYLQNGTLFSKYQYSLDAKSSGRMKPIFLNTFTGVAGIHWCKFCRCSIAPLHISRIAHFRSSSLPGNYTKNFNMNLYSLPLLKVLPYIN